MIHKCRETYFCKETSIPVLSIAFVAQAESLTESTVWDYIKNIKKLEENLKPIHKDKTPC